MNKPTRGISPEILLGHVKNTVPFVFKEEAPQTPYSKIFFAPLAAKFSHTEYFSLCLSAHYTTVASFVPTDVDNQIRKNLWQGIDLSTYEQMASLTMESLSWDFRPYTTRFQNFGQTYVSGHQGEWFSVAVGAYASGLIHSSPWAEKFMAAIKKELESEAKVFQGLVQAKDGIGALRACTLMAHNLGDLDRVMDQWELPAEDPLRKACYKLGHSPHPSFPFSKTFLQAGALNKEFMASENHRHYPLRKIKALRESLSYFLPTGPFFDSWGKHLGDSLELRDKLELTEALLEGFEKLSSPKVPLYGYARALAGLLASQKNTRWEQELPSKSLKSLQKGLLAELIREPKEVFENNWNKKALTFLSAHP